MSIYEDGSGEDWPVEVTQAESDPMSTAFVRSGSSSHAIRAYDLFKVIDKLRIRELWWWDALPPSFLLPKSSKGSRFPSDIILGVRHQVTKLTNRRETHEETNTHTLVSKGDLSLGDLGTAGDAFLPYLYGARHPLSRTESRYPERTGGQPHAQNARRTLPSAPDPQSTLNTP